MGVVKCDVSAKDMMSEAAMFFVHSIIDEFGFTPPQFRLMGHFVHRAGKFSRLVGSDHESSAGVRSIARVCRMNRSTVCKTIDELRGMNVIEWTGKPYTNCYRIRPMVEWLRPGSELRPIGTQVCQSEVQKEIPNPNDKKRKEEATSSGARAGLALPGRPLPASLLRIPA